MTIPFDPFDLTEHPICCPGLHRANAFMSGILFNRIAFDIAQGREIGFFQSVDYLEKLNKKIEIIEKNFNFLMKYRTLQALLFFGLLTKLLN